MRQTVPAVAALSLLALLAAACGSSAHIRFVFIKPVGGHRRQVQGVRDF